MSSDDTVHIDISIQIDVQDVVDTGHTVADWNAMTEEKRAAIVAGIWDEMAGSGDNGGVRVVTAGAEDI